MARIMLIDDDKTYRKMFRMVAEGAGHEVLEVDNLNETLETLGKIALGEIQPPPDVYAVDGNLDGSREGNDGRTILRKIGELGVEGTVIGNSGMPWDMFGEETHPNFDAQKDAFKAIDYIDQKN